MSALDKTAHIVQTSLLTKVLERKTAPAESREYEMEAGVFPQALHHCTDGFDFMCPP
jgi:hypothetical protein